MRTTTAIIIGGGQAGLAMSRCLGDHGIDHVILERGEVANSWRTERWDSLRLLTPNWMTRLPGHRYTGPDPDGYMTADETAGFLDGYRDAIAAPVITDCAVESVRILDPGFEVRTSQGTWRSDAVVVATGACSNPHVPAVASGLSSSIDQLTPIAYRNPGQVGEGRVLVVGASASGAQIADELARAGRDVWLAAGEHVRLPRTYRGHDIHLWMELIGQLDERTSDVVDVARARRLPSLQLVGSPERRSLGINELQASGVQVVGRLAAADERRAVFSGGLANQLTLADLKMTRLLDRVDEFVDATGLDVGAPIRPEATTMPDPVNEIDLAGVETVIWATGFRPSYPWLPDAVLDHKGAIRHDDGVMAPEGMYVLGLPFLRRRKSSFIDGVGPDAAELAHVLVQRLASSGHRVAA